MGIGVQNQTSQYGISLDVILVGRRVPMPFTRRRRTLGEGTAGLLVYRPIGFDA